MSILLDKSIDIQINDQGYGSISSSSCQMTSVSAPSTGHDLVCNLTAVIRLSQC